MIKLLFSIIINAGILYALQYFLSGDPAKGVESGVLVQGGYLAYIIGGVILGVLNFTVRPVLKIIAIPFSILTFGLIGFVLNGIILWLFDVILNDFLIIKGVNYQFVGVFNFIIGVAIFTILNTIYSLIFFKK